MTTPASTRRDVERNHEAIVAAAMRVLATSPEATLGEIVQASGVGRSTVYRHFPDREALVGAIVDRLLAESDALIAERIAAASDVDDAVETLVAVGTALATLGDRYGFIESDQAQRHARRSTGRAGRIQRLLDFVTAGQASGEIRTDLPASWLTSMFGHAVSEAAARDAPDQAARRAALAPTVRSLLAPSKPTSKR